MKKFFTLCFSAVCVLIVSAQTVPHAGPAPIIGQVSTDSLGYYFGLRTGWTVVPSATYPLVMDLTFDTWTDAAHLSNFANTGTGTTIKGRASATNYYDWSQSVSLLGPLAGKSAPISMFKCAVAPQGLSQNKIEFTKIDGNANFEAKANNYNSGQIPDPEDGVALPVGFLEVSRRSSNGTIVSVTNPNGNNGTVILPAIKGAVVVQYSYSSIGGSKRGLKLERSIDGGTTWQVIRNPMKSNVEWTPKDSTLADVTYPSTTAFTATVYKPFKSPYFCSGAGVRMEDFIGNGSESVMLRFSIGDAWATDVDRDANDLSKSATQDFRLHNIKLIATADAQLASVSNNRVSTTNVLGSFGTIELRGATAEGSIYSTLGQKVAVFTAGNQTIKLTSGMYMVVERNQPAVKVLVR